MEHNELEEMREQMALLNQKLDKEEIVSDEAISEVTRKNMDKLQRNALIIAILEALLIPLFIRDSDTVIGTIIWAIWGLSIFFGNLMLFIGLRNFKKKNDCIAKSIETIKITRKICNITGIINKTCFYSYLIIIFIRVIVRSAGSVDGLNEPEAIIRGMAGVVYFIMIIAFIGSFVYVFREIGKNDQPDVLDQILIELQEPNITETDGNETVTDTETGK